MKTSIQLFQVLMTWVLMTMFIFSCTPKPTGSNGETAERRNCGTMLDYQERLKNEPAFQRAEGRLETQIRNYIERNTGQTGFNFRTGTVTIPVVVHVVHNTTAQNISTAHIQSQIDVLNRDYRSTNTDIGSVPSGFSGTVSDSRIEFVLAKRDPNCNPTTGITRTSTSVSSFDFNPTASTATTRNPVKFTSSNGVDGWPSDEYLNIWVCNLIDIPFQLLGYASFPSELATRPAEDGVVVDFQFFGNIGTATAPFNLGRTATHEVGHWFNLRHIWGDDCNPVNCDGSCHSSECTGTDFVTDTPNAGQPNIGTPTFPLTDCCTSGGNGVMFMNYMDYVDDAAMIMFTNDQSDRMDAVLYTTRASLVGSQGDIAPTTAIAQDLFIKDTDADIGNEPNNESSTFYVSDDIWVRNANDGIVNQEHQNPIGGADNWVYVRVRNIGCGNAPSANVRLYWAKASTGLSWTFPWDGTGGGPPALGGPLGLQPTGVVSGSGETILVYNWNNTPNPTDYASFGADRTHFCLLARIETSSSSPFGMTFPEGTNLHDNVENNNNIAWKNVTVDETLSGGRMSGDVIVGNFLDRELATDLVITSPNKNFFIHEEGEILIEFDDKLMKALDIGGFDYSGLEKTNEPSTFQMINERATLRRLIFAPRKMGVLRITFVPNKDALSRDRKLVEINVEQFDSETNKIIGGETFKFKINKK